MVLESGRSRYLQPHRLFLPVLASVQSTEIEISQHYSIASITFGKVVPILFKSDFIALQVDTLCISKIFVVVDGSWVDLITRVDSTFFLERQGFASFMHKTIP